MRKARDGKGLMLKNRWVKLTPDRHTVIGCTKCDAELHVSDGVLLIYVGG